MWLTLTPLMGGSMSQQNRILAAYGFIRDSKVFSEEEKRKIEAVLYVMANKFLSSKGLKKLKGAMIMMPLGKMLHDEGLAESRNLGLAEGHDLGLTEGRFATIVGLIRNMNPDASFDNILKILNLESSCVKKIQKLIQEMPNHTDLQIAQAFLADK